VYDVWLLAPVFPAINQAKRKPKEAIYFLQTGLLNSKVERFAVQLSCIPASSQRELSCEQCVSFHKPG